MGVFSTAQEQLEGLFGKAQPLASNNGVRFRSGSKGLITLYSRNIASGNLAEMAFEVTNLAARAGTAESEIKSLIAELSIKTGQNVSIDPKFNWPRVGLANLGHVDLVLEALSKIPAQKG